MKKYALFLMLLITIISIYLIYPRKYDHTHFNIELVKSAIDYDNDGIDDYTDILMGAKKEALNRPKYKSAYYNGGYPPDDEGVCTDVIWRSLKEAGYNFKDLIDEDIKNNLESYPRVGGNPDPNIDFRRVLNHRVFFERNTISLTKDIKDISSWQPGDIVVFGNDHVAIISDIRNKKGIPYIIHNASQLKREENTFEKWAKNRGISGHFRFSIKENKDV